MRPDYERLFVSLVAGGVLLFLTVRGLKTGRLKTRWGAVITAGQRPLSFYATIFIYALLACACLFQAIRSAMLVLSK
jgi:hypothetical protein